ncbi:RibD family protein [Aerosakkonema funiforme]|uniref:RibD family protein n=1 Tax=Aerosakkonema funiforme TaxID=1246630 RepID=UPI0035B75C7D
MSVVFVIDRPYTTVVLAMTADGKITDAKASPARFGSPADKAHLEKQIALADAVIFGASTLRAYGTTLSVSNPQLLIQREQQNKPPQPLQIVCSRSGKIDPQIRFFRQPVPRWLLTTASSAQFWQERPEFERILVMETSEGGIDFVAAFGQMAELGLARLAVLGGGELVASLLAANLIDELWLTVCPLILGGVTAPTPVEGAGFSQDLAPRLQLLAVEQVEGEVFLHYRLQRSKN